MDAQAGPSHLIIPISPQPGQPADGSFANARHFEINQPLFL